MSRTRIITSWCDVGSVSDSSGWDVVQHVWLMRYWIMAWLEPPILYHMGRARKLRLIWNPLFFHSSCCSNSTLPFRLSEVHNGMDRLKPSPAGQMNRRSRSRDRDNWRGKMRLERGRCRGFPCFSMSICLIWCQKLVRNLGACSRYKVDAFLFFFSNATLQYWWAAPGQSDAWTRWILEASGKPTKINKNIPADCFPRVWAHDFIKKHLLWTTEKRGNSHGFVTLQFEKFSEICAITMGRKKVSLKHCYLHGIVTCPYFLGPESGVHFLRRFSFRCGIGCIFVALFVKSSFGICTVNTNYITGLDIVKYVPKQSIPEHFEHELHHRFGHV